MVVVVVLVAMAAELAMLLGLLMVGPTLVVPLLAMASGVAVILVILLAVVGSDD